ncbi:MAG: glycerophosphodiester phosphodiesterase family protein [Clostridia bacterium]|nr:glycerophosphodiester phosphodiesterase family protein [Clostridia bacterium]
MKFRKSAALILLALAVCLPALMFGGCKDVDPGADTGTLITEETTSVEVPRLSIDPDYLLVRPEKVGDALLSKVAGLRGRIEEKTGMRLTVKDDWLKPGDEPPAKEILIGATNRPESAEILEGVPLNGYAIGVIGEKIVINSRSEDAVIEAVERFMTELSDDGSIAAETILGSVPKPLSSLTINGRDISRFEIVYAQNAMKDAADGICAYLEKQLGASIPAVAAKNATDAPKFILGVCGLGEPDISDYGQEGYCVSATDAGVCFTGKTSYSVLFAFLEFADRYFVGTGDVVCNIPAGEKLIDAPLRSREEYIADPGLFPVKWAGIWQPSEELLDYGAKVDCLCAKNKDHIFTVSHRGDFLRYPENSLESVISVWRMGGDCAEIDIHFTADGVAVLVHDDTLTRMTDCASYLGKEGYPSGAAVSEWTLAQIRTLRLKAGQGGSSAALTSYVIPTLEEVLTAVKGRLFVILDKQALWRYCDLEGIQTQSSANIIFPIMQSTGNFESVLISYGTVDSSAAGTFSASDALSVQKYIYERTGEKTYFFLRGWTGRGTADPYATQLEKSSLTNSAILVNGAFDPTKSSTVNTVKSLIGKHPESMFGAWTIDSDGYDTAVTWEKMYGIGLRSIMTNDILALVKYAAAKIGG